MRQGEGEYKFVNGSVLQGTWVKDKMAKEEMRAELN